jgi:hypothetical protein
LVVDDLGFVRLSYCTVPRKAPKKGAERASERSALRVRLLPPADRNLRYSITALKVTGMLGILAEACVDGPPGRRTGGPGLQLQGAANLEIAGIVCP